MIRYFFLILSIYAHAESINPDLLVHPAHFVYKGVKVLPEDNFFIQVQGLKYSKRFPTRSSRKVNYKIPTSIYELEHKLAASVFTTQDNQRNAVFNNTKEIFNGTAFLLGGNYILTNYHVFDKNFSSNLKCFKFKVFVKDREKSVAFSCKKVWHCRKNMDYCLIEMKHPKARETQISDLVPRLKFNLSDIKFTDHYLSLGNGYGLGIQASWGKKLELLQNNYLIKHFAPLFPGFSGGPVFNDTGEVIAITYAQSKKTMSFESYNLARPIFALYEDLKNQDVPEKVIGYFE
jgi:hypothetical protein